MARGTIQYAASGKFASTGVDDNGDATTLTIDANENLGIGGVSPIGTHSTLTSVRVGGNAIINHTTASAASGSLDITQNANYDTDGSWEYIVTDEVSRYQQSGGEHIFSAAASGTAGNDITWVEALRIKADGKVGIGTDSPGTLLELAADAESTKATIATYSDTNTHVPSLYLEKSHSDTLGTNIATVDDEYLGEIRFAGFSNDNTIVYSSIIRAVQDGSPSTSTIGTDLEFYTQANGSAMGDARVIIKSDGKVGIGTTAPDGTLHIHTGSAGSITAESASNNLVVENSTDAGISILSPQGYYQRLYFGHDADADAGQIIYGGANVGYAGNRNHMLFYTDGSEKMRIASDGKVGIGTNSPNQNLDVLNTAQITGAEGTSASLYLVSDEGDDNGDGWRINSNQDDNDLTISNNTSGSYVDKLTIKTNGDIVLKNNSFAVGDDMLMYQSSQTASFTATTNGVEQTINLFTIPYSQAYYPVTIHIYNLSNGALHWIDRVLVCNGYHDTDATVLATCDSTSSLLDNVTYSITGAYNARYLQVTLNSGATNNPAQWGLRYRVGPGL